MSRFTGMLERHEGKELKIYTDTEGNVSIGTVISDSAGALLDILERRAVVVDG